MTPALQSPAHGCRLRHLSALIALKPCTYTKGEILKINFHFKLIISCHRLLCISQFPAQQRKAVGLTQKEPAKHLLVADKTVSRGENGHGYPETEHLESI